MMPGVVDLLRAIIRLPLRLVPRNAILRIRSGPLRGLKWVAGSAPHGSWLGTYERHVQQLFCERIRPGDVVFDVGANVGFFTLLASKLAGPAGHVYAFEPFPRNLSYIEKHLRLNDVANVTVQPIAIASTSGSARFGDGENDSQGKLSEKGELLVRTASLDDLMTEGSVRKPAFIKMDIEGAESDALRGASTLLCASGITIVLSTHGHMQQEQCWSLLQRQKFKLELLRDGVLDGDYLILGTK
jgi:FkbM family methyltransferase